MLLSLLLMMSFAACKKESEVIIDNSNVDLSRREMLTGGYWLLSAFNVSPALDWDGNGTMVTDIWANIESCKSDDIIRFSLDSTYSKEEGTSMCQQYDLQVFERGVWTFMPNQDSILFTPGNCNCVKPYAVRIDALTSVLFRYSFIIRTGEIDYTYTQSYTRQ